MKALSIVALVVSLLVAGCSTAPIVPPAPSIEGEWLISAPTGLPYVGNDCLTVTGHLITAYLDGCSPSTSRPIQITQASVENDRSVMLWFSWPSPGIFGYVWGLFHAVGYLQNDDTITGTIHLTGMAYGDSVSGIVEIDQTFPFTMTRR